MALREVNQCPQPGGSRPMGRAFLERGLGQRPTLGAVTK